jgi:hypothetical protein
MPRSHLAAAQNIHVQLHFPRSMCTFNCKFARAIHVQFCAAGAIRPCATRGVASARRALSPASEYLLLNTPRSCRTANAPLTPNRRGANMHVPLHVPRRNCTFHCTFHAQFARSTANLHAQIARSNANSPAQYTFNFAPAEASQRRARFFSQSTRGGAVARRLARRTPSHRGAIMHVPLHVPRRNCTFHCTFHAQFARSLHIYTLNLHVQLQFTRYNYTFKRQFAVKRAPRCANIFRQPGCCKVQMHYQVNLHAPNARLMDSAHHKCTFNLVYTHHMHVPWNLHAPPCTFHGICTLRHARSIDLHAPHARSIDLHVP